MNIRLKTSLVCALALSAACGRCLAETNLTGIVVSGDGKPLKDALYRLTGLGEAANFHVSRGIVGWSKTDSEGRFAVTLPSGDALANLQFDYGQLAPVVLSKVRAGDSALRVVMTSGMLVQGRIMSLARGKRVPIQGATIALEMPQGDFWYRKEQRTSSDGSFYFRIPEPPTGLQWQLEYAGKRFKIEYDPQRGAHIELDADITMTVSAEPGAAPNGGPAKLPGDSEGSGGGRHR